ncbi:MAG: hypothetical protein ACPG80_02055 [Rickettsiales bacterium]
MSPVMYEGHSCKQIRQEMLSVSRRVSELTGSLDKKANDDAVQMGVGLVLFWPALFFLEGGDGAQAQEYARLKGEFNALEDVAIQKGCGFEVEEYRPKAPEKTPRKPDDTAPRRVMR